MIVVDARGLKCPLPRIKAELALRQISCGDTITLICDDPESPIDIAAWCQHSGNPLAHTEQQQNGWRFAIKKC